MILLRTDFLETGIFGTLTIGDTADALMFHTLEHAYSVKENGVEKFLPKLPAGTYQCIRGTHRLEHVPNPFETFEIMNVPGHDNILFHVGNTNADSSGCVLLGQLRMKDLEILQSRAAFKLFMDSLKYVDSFELTVISQPEQEKVA